MASAAFGLERARPRERPVGPPACRHAAGTLPEDFFAHSKRGLLSKPYRLDELLSAISELLDPGLGTDPAPKPGGSSA